MGLQVKDLVDFVIKNRRGKAFEGREIEDIIHEIRQALHQSCISWCVDKENKIVGLALGTIIPEQNVFYVTNILTTRPKVMAILLDKFQQLYPGYRLEARRHGKIKRYNTDKFLQKVKSFYGRP